MSTPRFTVKWHYMAKGRATGAIWGYIVFDRNRPISIPFADYDEACRRRDNIHALYLRWGW